uniref:Uncharacterized protein n=1 Tax=Anopheles braziliensis TaxID=58242 RepID=A0A2M3ZLY4_9DIPT
MDDAGIRSLLSVLFLSSNLVCSWGLTVLRKRYRSGSSSSRIYYSLCSVCSLFSVASRASSKLRWCCFRCECSGCILLWPSSLTQSQCCIHVALHSALRPLLLSTEQDLFSRLFRPTAR